MMQITIESGLKNSNKWLTVQSGDVELLRKASIVNFIDAIGQYPDELDIEYSACWAFDSESNKVGYLLTITAKNNNGEIIEVAPTTVYPFNQQRVFKTLDALHNFLLGIGAGGFSVYFG